MIEMIMLMFSYLYDPSALKATLTLLAVSALIGFMNYRTILTLMRELSLPWGVFLSLVGSVEILANMSTSEGLNHQLVKASLPLFYGLVLHNIITFIDGHLSVEDREGDETPQGFRLYLSGLGLAAFALNRVYNDNPADAVLYVHFPGLIVIFILIALAKLRPHKVPLTEQLSALTSRTAELVVYAGLIGQVYGHNEPKLMGPITAFQLITSLYLCIIFLVIPFLKHRAQEPQNAELSVAQQEIQEARLRRFTHLIAFQSLVIAYLLINLSVS